MNGGTAIANATRPKIMPVMERYVSTVKCMAMPRMAPKLEHRPVRATLNLRGNHSDKHGMNKCRLTSLVRFSYLAPNMVRALLEGRQPIELTTTRLLRLSKDLPHDWKEQRRFRPPKPPSKPSRNAPHPTTRKRPRETLRPFAPRTRTFGVSGCRRCVRRRANARKFQDYSGDRGNYKYAAI